MHGIVIYLRINDVGGWQFLTIEAAEFLCMVSIPPEEHIFGKRYLDDQPFKNCIL